MILQGTHITKIRTITGYDLLFQSRMALKMILTMFEQVWMSKGAWLAEVPRWNHLWFRTSWFQRNVPAQVGDTSWSH